MTTSRRVQVDQAGSTSRAGVPAARPSLPDGLDLVDLQLLALLIDDARLSQRALAREIGMSAAAVSERIARLEERGVIEGYQAQVSYRQGEDQRRLAGDLIALAVVRLRVRDHAQLREVFFDHLLPMPGVHRTESFISLENVTSSGLAGAVVRTLLEPDASASGLD